MTTYLVGTLARYVLVDANDEAEARALGQPALHEQFADIRARLGREVPINITTVRPATPDEIDLQRWHDETVGLWVRNRP
jgi:hypothetical protein